MTLVNINKEGVGGSSLPGTEPRYCALVRVGNTDGHLAASGSSVGGGQHSCRLPVLKRGGSHRVELRQEDGEVLVQDVGRPQIDLFASAFNTHLSIWYNRTYHPEAIAPDALLQPWTGLSLYAFPPFLLLPKTLVKIWADEAEEVIVIALTWPRRSLYVLLLQMACKIPCLLPLNMDLLSRLMLAKGMLYHSDLKTLRLATWKLSSRPSRVPAF